MFGADDGNRSNSASPGVPVLTSLMEPTSPHHSPCSACSCFPPTLSFSRVLHVFFAPPLTSWSQWLCVGGTSVVISKAVKDIFDVGAGQEGGEFCLLHHHQADLLLAAPPSRLSTSWEAACDAFLVFLLLLAPDQLVAQHQEQHIPLTAHLQLLGDIFACSSTSLLQFQQ